MRLLIILILGTALAYVLIVRDMGKREASSKNPEPTADAPVRSRAPVQSESMPAGPVVKVTRLRSVAVRGQIVDSDAGGVQVDCSYVPPVPRYDANLSATAGAAASRSLAELVTSLRQKDIAKAFGPLRMRHGSRFVEVDWEPPKKATGVVQVIGLPQMRTGDTINIVTAPVANGVLTAAVELAPDAPGDWMHLPRDASRSILR